MHKQTKEHKRVEGGARRRSRKLLGACFAAICLMMLVEARCISAKGRPKLSSIKVAAVADSGGRVFEGEVTLTGAAPKRGAVVKLSIEGPRDAIIAESVTVPAKQSSARFTIVTQSAPASLVVSATYRNSTKVLRVSMIDPPPVAQGSQFYVAPNGSPAGNGSLERPWDLQTALAHPAAVKPGDTIWLRGGIYTKAWTTNSLYKSTLRGAESAPIIVRQYAGERAIIDGGSSPAYKDHHALRIDGAHAWFWGFEVMFSDAKRTSAVTGSSPTDLRRGRGVTIFGNNIKCINMVVHDAAIGFSFWTPGENSELYGCIIYYNGWQSDRGHGHGIYAHNETGTKRVTSCIMFKQFRNGIQVYNDDAGDSIDNVVLEGNIAFENGALAESGYARDFLYGGNGVARNPALVRNYAYSNLASSKGENNLGYDAGTENAQVLDNYFASGGAAFTAVNSPGAKITGNTFVGDVEGFTRSSAPNNAYFSARPAGVKTFVIANAYERGRAHIAVYNWDNRDEVSVDLSSAGLREGEAFEVVDVQNYFGPPVLTAVYEGKPVSLPMNSTAVAPPIGKDVPVAARHTPKEFGAFVVRKL